MCPRSRRLAVNVFYWFVVALIWPFIKIWYRWDFKGLDKVPRGGVILASNHISYLDPIAVGYLGLRLRRPVRFLAKVELFHKKGLGFALRHLGQIEVRRGTRDAAASLEAAERALAAGECISVFPEGTISYETFEPMRPKTGVGRLAAATRVPVVPVAIWGDHRALTKHRKPDWKPGFAISMRCGEPLEIEESETPAAFARRVMDAVSELLVETVDAYPQKAADDSAWWLPASRRIPVAERESV